ncbi:MAG: glycosyltransferase family 2 protein [Prevotella sp.]|nr:glycosyltransferase family 2 protein [Prevotella sp.]
MNKLSVVIVSYNVKYYIEQCLHSLQRAVQGIDASIYVVDNHSNDDSVAYLKSRFPDVHLISSPHNNGFSYANNVALRQCDSEYVLLLNPDTFVGEDVIRKMVAFCDAHPQAGGVGVQMLNADGTKAPESRRGLPTPAVALYKMIGLCTRFPQHKKYGKYYMSYLSWDEAAKIEVISGACFMIRKRVLDEIGLLDETFFMYGEDIDLSYRILKAGYDNWYLPVRILHYKGESTHKSSYRYVHVFYQAMLIFFKKHFRHLSFWFSLPIQIAIYLKAFTTLLLMQADNLQRYLNLSKRRNYASHYVFIGGREMLEKSRTLTKAKGLNASFVEADATSHPQGYWLSQPDSQLNYVYVYDVHAFQYQEVLDIFSKNKWQNVHLGTFDTQTDVVITHNEVLVG